MTNQTQQNSYRWVILFMAGLCLFATGPAQSAGIGVFFEPLTQDLKISLGTLSIAYAIGTIISSLLMIFVFPRTIKKLGFRSSISLLLAMLAVFILLLSFTSAGISQVTFLVLCLLFLGIRFTGQGGLSTEARSMLVPWFGKKTGLATGLSVLGLSCLFVLAAGLELLNSEFGWRVALRVTSIALFVFAIICFVVIRDLDSSTEGTAKEEEAESIFSSGVFWLYLSPVALGALINTAVFLNLYQLFEAAEVQRTKGYLMIAPVFITTSIIVSIFSGWIADKVRLKYLLIALTLSCAATCFAVLKLEGQGLLWVNLLVVFAATTQALIDVLPNPSWRRFFDERQHRQIHLVSNGVLIFSTALGAIGFGLAKDYLGTYNLPAVVCALLTLVILPFAVFSKESSPQ